MENSLSLRLDWSEMDLFGHINNVSYFKYLQASRVNFWELLELNSLFATHQIGPTLAKTECSFSKALHYPGTIKVEVWIDWIKKTSFQLHHFIYNDDGQLCAEGRDIVVFFDYNLMKKKELSESQVQLMSRFILLPNSVTT